MAPVQRSPRSLLAERMGNGSWRSSGGGRRPRSLLGRDEPLGPLLGGVTAGRLER